MYKWKDLFHVFCPGVIVGSPAECFSLVFRRREQFQHLEVEKYTARAIEHLFLFTCSPFICTSYTSAFFGWFFNLCVCFFPCYGNIADCWQNIVFCKQSQAVTCWSVETLSLDSVAKVQRLSLCPLTRDTLSTWTTALAGKNMTFQTSQ